MSDEIEISVLRAEAEQAIKPLKEAIGLAQKGRERAYEVLEQGRPLADAIGMGAYFESSMVVLGAAAAGASAGSVFGPIGSAVGGFLGALISAMSQPAIGVVTVFHECTLPDGTKTTVRNQDCTCLENFTMLSGEELDARFNDWLHPRSWNYGYEYERKYKRPGYPPEFFSTNEARAWWEQHRNPNELKKRAILERCLPQFATTPEGRIAAERQFGGRWGERWRFNDEILMQRKVSEIPSWVPAVDSDVSRILIIAFDLGLDRDAVSRVAQISDPRVGVASVIDRLETLRLEERKAVIANAVVIAVAKSAGVVPAGEDALEAIGLEINRLGVDQIGRAELEQAWIRLAAPNVSLLPVVKPNKKLVIAIGLVAVACAAFILMRKARWGF